jgi:hypothetical protein
VYDALNRLKSPNFFLWVDVEGKGSSDLRTKNLRSSLRAGHRQLVEFESIEAISPFEWRVDDVA